MVGGSLATTRPRKFLVTSRSGGHGTAGTVADDRPVIPQAREYDITLVSWNCHRGIVEQCFRDVNL